MPPADEEILGVVTVVGDPARWKVSAPIGQLRWYTAMAHGTTPVFGDTERGQRTPSKWDRQD